MGNPPRVQSTQYTRRSFEMCVAKNNGDVIGWGQTMKGAVYQARNIEFYSVAMGNHQEIVSNKMT